VKLAELLNECDILGVKTYSDPSNIFSGRQDPLTLMIYAPERIWNDAYRALATFRCTKQACLYIRVAVCVDQLIIHGGLKKDPYGQCVL